MSLRALYGLPPRALACALLVIISAAAPALASPAPPAQLALPTRAPIPPVMACADLPHADLSGAEAPTSLVSASLVGDGPAQYCDVKGWIAPQTQFELRLPTSTWQGRYLQTGCGGNCGVVTIAVSPPADTDAALGSNTFAVSTNDAGDVVRTYPVPVYPARAQYTGSGDVNDAANWTSASPASPPDDHFAWLGDPAGSLVGGDAQR